MTTFLRILAVALAAAVLPGCSLFYQLRDGDLRTGVGYVTYGGSSLVPPDALKAPGNSFVSMENRKGGPGAYGFVSSPFDLWAPFRWELSVGQFDSDSEGSGTGFACTELDVRGSSPLEFYALCTRKDPAGYTCWVAKPGVSVVAQVVLTATGIVQMAVEHTGTELVFSVKRPGDESWTTITTIPHTQVAALVPSIGFAQAPERAQIDFDDLRIVFNGPLPEGATANQVLARAVMDAGMPLAVAARSIDGGIGYGLGTAADSLEEAIAALAAAETTVANGAATLADPKAGTKAAKLVKAARKAAEKAGRTFEKGGSRRAVSTALQKAMADVFMATQLLDPHTLPGG
jgi:hypothetical protein